MQKEEKIDHSGNHKGNTTKSKNIEDFFICMSHLWFDGHRMTNCPKFIEMQKMFHEKSVTVIEVQLVTET
jgi:hypothetical protein